MFNSYIIYFNFTHFSRGKLRQFSIEFCNAILDKKYSGNVLCVRKVIAFYGVTRCSNL
jgi:hypothetical protein